MRYHYIKPNTKKAAYGIIYECDHPVYDRCTLFVVKKRGLAVIQQYKDTSDKKTYWKEVCPWITNELYFNQNFKAFFDERSGECVDGLYPTVTIRQIMWALKMKPLPKERWETTFDRRDI